MKNLIFWIVALSATVAVSAAAPPTTSSQTAPTPGQLQMDPPLPMPATNAPAPATAPAVTTAPQRPDLPPGAQEVLAMAQAHVGDSVLIEYIKNSTHDFSLNADQIVYLRDVGLSETVVAEMIRRSNELAVGGPQPSANETSTPTPAAAPASAETSAPEATAASAQATPKPTATAATTTPTSAASATSGGTHEVASPSAVPAPTSVYSTPVAAAPSPPSAPSAPSVANGYWYNTLSPYGTWMWLPDYGWCWQPTCAVTDSGWRPYFQRGYWVWTDDGWYWVSDYSWGWVTFHYGRWYLSPTCGWVWVPGYVWGPAWVTWRTTADYCGWAPLPPEACWVTGVGLTYWGSSVGLNFGFGLGWSAYSFVPWGHLCHRHLAHYALPRHEVRIVCGGALVHNLRHGRHHRVVNEGVPPQRFPLQARHEVRRVQLREIRPVRGSPLRPDRFVNNDHTLAVYRPTVRAQSHAPSATFTSYRSGRSSQEVRPLSRPANGGKRSQESIVWLSPTRTGAGLNRRPPTPVQRIGTGAERRGVPPQRHTLGRAQQYDPTPQGRATTTQRYEVVRSGARRGAYQSPVFQPTSRGAEQLQWYRGQRWVPSRGEVRRIETPSPAFQAPKLMNRTMSRSSTVQFNGARSFGVPRQSGFSRGGYSAPHFSTPAVPRFRSAPAMRSPSLGSAPMRGERSVSRSATPVSRTRSHPTR